MSTASASSAVNHVNDVNRVNDVKTPTPAACGGVSGGRPPAAAVGGLRRLRLRFWGDACGGGSAVRPPAAAFGGAPPAAAGFSDVIDAIDAVDVIDSGRG